MKAEQLVLGTAQLMRKYGAFDERLPDRVNVVAAAAILNEAFLSGITHIDTAPSYGEAERVLGSSGIPFTVDTKVSTVEGAISSVKESSQKLAELHIETLYFHNPVRFDPEEIELILTLLEFRGKLFDRLGISVYSVEEFFLAIDSGLIDSIQVPYSVLDRRFSADLLNLAISKGIEIHARSIFAQGTLTAGHPPPFPISQRLEDFLKLFWAVCKKYEQDFDSVALHWATRNSNVTRFIFGAQNPYQIRRIVTMLDHKLPPACLEELDNLVPAPWPDTDPRYWI